MVLVGLEVLEDSRRRRASDAILGRIYSSSRMTKSVVYIFCCRPCQDLFVSSGV